MANNSIFNDYQLSDRELYLDTENNENVVKIDLAPSDPLGISSIKDEVLIDFVGFSRDAQ